MKTLHFQDSSLDTVGRILKQYKQNTKRIFKSLNDPKFENKEIITFPDGWLDTMKSKNKKQCRLKKSDSPKYEKTKHKKKTNLDLKIHNSSKHRQPYRQFHSVLLAAFFLDNEIGNKIKLNSQKH